MNDDRTSGPTRTGMTGGRRGRLLAVGSALAVTIGVSLVQSGPAQGDARASGPTAYQRQLVAEVQDGAGAPRTGSDPARQRQGSLAAAASRPQGTGLRSTRPATGVRTGSVVRQAPRPAIPGVTSGGCALGYGTAGAQCMPARGPGNTTLTCTYVLSLFPDGIRVTGPDRLRLDTDRDSVACGPRDAGVPPPAGRRSPVPHAHD